MAGFFSVEDVLAAIIDEADQLLEEPESDCEVEGIFSYGPGGPTEVEFNFGGDNIQEEGDAMIGEEDTGQPVPTEFRDQVDGEH